MAEYLTPEEIAAACDDLDGLSNIKAINKLYRQQDESHTWPISGRFNATERAIRKAREIARANGAFYGLEYSMTIDAILSEIVNNPRNH